MVDTSQDTGDKKKKAAAFRGSGEDINVSSERSAQFSSSLISPALVASKSIPVSLYQT